jgi:heme/copper-type cytochrome/quinol oxidase subunit 2
MKTSSVIAVAIFITTAICLEGFAQAPPGIPEINQGKSMMAQNFRALSSAVLILGAIFGLLGGLRIYNNWQFGRRNIDQEVAGWFGACIFLSILGIFLSVLFNVPAA